MPGAGRQQPHLFSTSLAVLNIQRSDRACLCPLGLQVAFVAMVEDANKHHQVEAPAKSAGTGTTPANDGSEGPATGGPSGAVAAASSRQVKEEDEDEQDGAAGGGGTTSDGTRDGTTDAGPVDDELGHAGARLRRTPKRALGSPVGSKVGPYAVC